MTASPWTLPPPAYPRRRALADLGLWLIAIVVVVGVGFGLNLAKVPQVPRQILGEPIAMIALSLATLAILRRRGETWRDLGLTRPASLRRTAALTFAGLIVVFGLSAALNLLVFRPLHLAPPHTALFKTLLATPLTFAALLVLAWTTVAFGEEFQFRGFLFSRLQTLFGRSRAGTFAALLAQALLFGLPHAYQGLAGVIATSVMGLVLGCVFLLNRRNLAASIALHALIDTLSLSALFLAMRLGIPTP